MIKRTLYFGSGAYLKKEREQLVVDFKESDKESQSVPIEDIGIVVLDHPQISVTHGLLNALIGNNAAILVCDAHHLPNGLVLPMSSNSTFTEKLRYQVNASEPLKKQLWKQTIQAKIRNQAAVLKSIEQESPILMGLVQKVASGDVGNIEAQAAGVYWKVIGQYFTDFIRHRYGSPPNNLLNYGYAILRGVVARSLVGSGCLPALGIHHRNKYNAFCLADDMMEPYRPYIDKLVLSYCFDNEDIPTELTKKEKAYLLQIPTLDTEIEGIKSPLMIAVQRSTASLVSCFEGKSRMLLFPKL